MVKNKISYECMRRHNKLLSYDEDKEIAEDIKSKDKDIIEKEEEE